jgi:hypothetical protein
MAAPLRDLMCTDRTDDSSGPPMQEGPTYGWRARFANFTVVAQSFPRKLIETADVSPVEGTIGLRNHVFLFD